MNTPPQESGAAGSAGNRELLAGTVERVTFHNPDNGFSVLRIKARGHPDQVTVVGSIPTINAGEFVQASGHWVVDRSYGRQFKAEFLRTAAPSTVKGIERYLASGLIKGIGEVYARKLVAAFGESVFDVIDRQPDRLRGVDGIGPKRAEAILAGWVEQKAIREIMVFLHQHGLGTSRATRIFRTYGAGALRVISENPYRLAEDIRGVGFRTADAIAARTGIEPTALIRRRAALRHILRQAVDEGHCALPEPDLMALSAQLLEAGTDAVAEALEAEVAEGALIRDDIDGTACVFLNPLHAAENQIARRLGRLRRGAPPWPPIDVEKAIPWVEDKLGIALADSQRQALATALRSKVVVVTGGPGVGKTTLMRALLRIVIAKRARVALAAPTGRAAKRLSESSGLEAKTVHRLLEVDARHGGFRRTAENPLECDLLVVDEVSMVDVPLMEALLTAVPDAAAVVLVGDADQLPSVGPGQVLADIIAAGVVPVVRLTEVFRQAAASRIIVNAHRIRRGEMPVADDGPGSDFRFVACDEADEGAAQIRRLIADEIPRHYGLDGKRDVQVLCPMNAGRLGARTLNLDLQAALNPPGAAAIERFGWRFAVGDKVIQVENNYDKDVYNGDLGLIAAINADDSEVVVNFDNRAIAYAFDELDQLALAYAITIHKAQGSEYPAVVVPITTQAYPMLQRRLLYTAITRGRRLVVVVGQMKAVAMAVKGERGGRRFSKLKAFLQQPSAPR